MHLFTLTYMYPGMVDPLYIILVMPCMVFALFTQWLVKSRFSRYSTVRARNNMTGREAARRILDANHLQHVPVQHVSGVLTDHYDPTNNSLSLSDSTYNENSIAAIGVAAHEVGHAIQDQQEYLPNKIRSFLVPVASIGSAAGPYLALFGLLMNFKVLLNIGILLYLGAVLFYFVTLPVEFNASSRALKILTDNAYLTDEELHGVRKVLGAAALTYVASAATAFASLLRLILLSRRNND